MCHKMTWYVIIRLNGKVSECPLWREQGSIRSGHKVMEHEKVARAQIFSSSMVLDVRKKTRPVDYVIIIEPRHVTITTSTRDNYQYLPLPAVTVTHDMYFHQDIGCLEIDSTILLIASTEGFASAMGNSLLRIVPSSR